MYFFLYVLLAILAYHYYFRTLKLDKDSIVDSWGVLVPDAAGKKDAVFAAVRAAIEEQDPPRIVVEEKEVSDRLVGRWTEEGDFTKRTMLTVRNTRIRGVVSFVSVRDYGKALQVSWYSTQEPNTLARFFSTIANIHWAVSLLYLPFILAGKVTGGLAKNVSPENLGLFDQEELSAFIPTVHRGVKQAVEAVMKELNQDFSKVDTKTRGFLNIS